MDRVEQGGRSSAITCQWFELNPYNGFDDPDIGLSLMLTASEDGS